MPLHGRVGAAGPRLRRRPDCADFAARREVQAVLNADRSAPNGLADDYDSVAFESLP